MKRLMLVGAAMAAASLAATRRVAGELAQGVDLLDFPDLGYLSGAARRRGYSTLGRSYDARSRYMPHIGAKERARHAGKPDGVMHAVPPIHLRNAAALAASKRKPRKAAAS